MAKISIRSAVRADVPAAADLIVRTKRLNNEFDPLFAVSEDARNRAESYISESLDLPDKLVLVAAEGERIVGVLRAEIRERPFYEPSPEGFITDFYILPEKRRKTLGHDILDQASTRLRKMGAAIIVAEVPSRNEIAVNFYTKRGFRSLVQHFGWEP